jgi:methionine synthase II (cobalamin-independent)
MASPTADRDARELVAKSCRMVGGLGLTKAATGHVSQRSPDGKQVLIRARGRDETGVRFTTADEVIAVDMDGRKVDGPDGLAAPSEVYLHMILYRTRPEVQSVVHIHPATVVLFTICNKPLQPLYGGYEPVAEALFGSLAVDGYFLEYNDERSGDFSPLRHLPKGKKVVLGLVTTKRRELENPDDLKRRIDEAARVVPVDQLCLSPQCGFSSGVGRKALDIDDERRKLDLVVATALDVWGAL